MRAILLILLGASSVSAQGYGYPYQTYEEYLSTYDQRAAQKEREDGFANWQMQQAEDQIENERNQREILNQLREQNSRLNDLQQQQFWDNFEPGNPMGRR